MRVVNPDLSKAKVNLVDPNPWGYLLLVSETNPASVATDANQAEDISIQGGPESVSDLRADFYKKIDPIRNALDSLDDVHAVSVFEAILFAPSSLDTYQPRSPDSRPARFDSIVVIETHSPADMDAVRSTPAFGELLSTVRGRSTYTEVITVTNAKKIADVDRRNPGVFLFNFFFAEDPQRLLDIWDYTAGWWETVGKMHNSELLVPMLTCACTASSAVRRIPWAASCASTSRGFPTYRSERNSSMSTGLFRSGLSRSPTRTYWSSNRTARGRSLSAPDSCMGQMRRSTPARLSRSSKSSANAVTLNRIPGASAVISASSGFSSSMVA